MSMVIVGLVCGFSGAAVSAWWTYWLVSRRDATPHYTQCVNTMGRINDELLAKMVEREQVAIKQQAAAFSLILGLSGKMPSGKANRIPVAFDASQTVVDMRAGNGEGDNVSAGRV